MSYRFMRVLVMFDLPMQSSTELRHYRKFRKMLINNGFIMFQYSVYTKVVLNHSVKDHYINILKKNAPPDGHVYVMTLTEKQFNSIEFICGEYETDVISDTERNVFL